MSIAAIAAITATGAELAPSMSPSLVSSSLAPPDDVDAFSAVADLSAPGESAFDGIVNSIGEIDQSIAANGRATTELALGQSDNLHQVMIASERTRLQFDLVMSMRNRVLEAYQEIMRMQV